MSGNETGRTERVSAVTQQVNEFGKAVGVLEDTVANIRNRIVPVSRPVEAQPLIAEKELVEPAGCPLSKDIGGYVGLLNLQIGSLREAIDHLEI